MKLLLIFIPLFSFGASLYLNDGTKDRLVSYENENNYALVGDILVADLENRDKGVGRVFLLGGKWKNGVIPFKIDPKLDDTDKIEGAIEHYHSFTDLKLVPRTGQKDYVYFKYNGKKGSCSSFVGRKGGKQIINLPDWCDQGGVIHELGHAFGLLHEQQHPDRDKYLTIHHNNIKPLTLPNFWKVPLVGKSYSSFDFDSIMLYHSFAFTKNGEMTITRKDGTKYKTSEDVLSEGDIESLRAIYK